MHGAYQIMTTYINQISKKHKTTSSEYSFIYVHEIAGCRIESIEGNVTELRHIVKKEIRQCEIVERRKKRILWLSQLCMVWGLSRTERDSFGGKSFY